MTFVLENYTLTTSTAEVLETIEKRIYAPSFMKLIEEIKKESDEKIKCAIECVAQEEKVCKPKKYSLTSNWLYAYNFLERDEKMGKKTEKTNEIILFENQNVKLEVNMQDETVWLTQEQMSKLFDKDRTVITRHISNIFKDGELEEKGNVQKMHFANSDKPVNLYNLDVIISVGYRVKSKNGIIFRRWANKILKDYLIKGYAINQKRLNYLEKTIKLIDIANRMDTELKGNEAREIIKVINNYSSALNLLDDYDHKKIVKPEGVISNKMITYEDCKKIIQELKFNHDSNLFALERNDGLKAILGSIYQSFDGKDLYPTIQEKGSNFLYLLVKNHVFIDGNKRIAATLFIYFLQYYDILMKENHQVIDNSTLVAITLLIAESNPHEKQILIDLIMNFLQ